MTLRKRKPTSPGRRFQTSSDFSEITKTTPEKTLLVKKSKTGGRNSYGRKTSRHRGGGHKQQYRIIDFKRIKDGVPPRSPPSNTTRTAPVALRCCTTTTARRPTSWPRRAQRRRHLQSGQGADIKPGNALPLRYIPVGTTVHNVELRPVPGGKIGPFGRDRGPVGRQGRRLRHAAYAVAPRCAECRSTAVPPSARSATPSTSSSRSARPAVTAGRA